MKVESLSDIYSGGYHGAKMRAQNRDPGALAETAKQYEAYFVQQMLKAMRASLPGDPFFSSHAGEMYQDLLDQHLSLKLAAGKGIGFADMLERNLSMAEVGTGKTALTDPIPVDGKTASEGSEFSPPANYAGLSTAARSGEGAMGSRNAVGTSVSGPGEAALVARLRLEGLSNQEAAARSVAPATVAAPAPERGPGAPRHGWGVVANDTFDSSTPQRFAQSLRPHAERAAAKLGVPAALLIAQAALETGWGRHIPTDVQGRSTHNLFGIKAGPEWEGPVVKRQTQEFVGRGMRTEDAEFRAYRSVSESFDDYVQFVSGNKRYAGALQANTGENYIRGLQKAGYATDPHYANKVLSILHRLPIDRAQSASAAPEGASSLLRGA